jgi:PAS domain S-box-containing protein
VRIMAEEATIEKAFAAEKNVSAIRVAIVVFNSLAYFLFLNGSQTIQWLSYAVMIVSLVYCFSVHFFKPYRRYPVMLSSYFISCTDVLLITIWLYATGGVDSPYHVLWYAAIISIAFRYSLSETLTATLLYSVCYLILAVVMGQIGSYTTELVVRIGYIFLIGSLGALFAQEALDQIRAKLELRDLAQRLEIETKERKRAEEQLRSSEERLRLIIEQTPAVLWTIDADLQFTYSPGIGLKVLGFKPDQIAGMNLLDYFPADTSEFAAIAAHRRALSGESVKQEMVWQERSYQWYLEPLRDAHGKIIGGIGISFDITDSKQAEAQQLQLAIEQERVTLLENFINNISHDLKTPLSVIYTNIYLLEQSTETEKQLHRLETIKAQTHHLERLIQDILTMSRLEKNSTHSFKAFDLNRLFQIVYQKFLSQFEQKHLTITLDLDPSLPYPHGDEEMLHTAFVSLVENAVNYTSHGGTLTLRTYQEGAEIVAEVQDTGIGIAESDIPHIFEPFYRVDEARGAEKGGTGLGLAIVQKIIEIHQGRIKVESASGHGSRFLVSIPTSVSPEKIVTAMPLGIPQQE